MPRAKHLTWEESACYTLTLATAYRMLFGHRPHILRPGHNVLVWGASGGLGSMAVQLIATAGANAIGVISDETQARLRHALGAKGVINRNNFNCWGQLPDVDDAAGYDDYMKRCREFGKAIWDVTGKGIDVDFVFEHPGEQTFPVSCFVVKRGGMVVFCAGTTGYNLTFDARFVWMRQKRIQGSHFANLLQASQANQLVVERRIDPCMSEVFAWARHPARPYQDVEEPAQARQYGRAGPGQAARLPHPGRRDRRRKAIDPRCAAVDAELPMPRRHRRCCLICVRSVSRGARTRAAESRRRKRALRRRRRAGARAARVDRRARCDRDTARRARLRLARDLCRRRCGRRWIGRERLGDARQARRARSADPADRLRANISRRSRAALPMSQGEIVRPADLGLQPTADLATARGRAATDSQRADTAVLRARLAALIADGEFGERGARRRGAD